MRIYLDAVPVIYAVEQSPGYERFSTTGAVLVASDLTRMECRVKPLRDNDADLLADYDRFFEEALSECVALTRRYSTWRLKSGRDMDSRHPMPSTSPHASQAVAIDS